MHPASWLGFLVYERPNTTWKIRAPHPVWLRISAAVCRVSSSCVHCASLPVDNRSTLPFRPLKPGARLAGESVTWHLKRCIAVSKLAHISCWWEVRCWSVVAQNAGIPTWLCQKKSLGKPFCDFHELNRTFWHVIESPECVADYDCFKLKRSTQEGNSKNCEFLMDFGHAGQAPLLCMALENSSAHMNQFRFRTCTADLRSYRNWPWELKFP